ncbi:MAG: hypothetical protein JWO13_473 [Acidobacteriales bacterium]|nr:hypothetical protein [Terriglobales bacterium]
MAKTFATVLGVIFVLVGIIGFIKHDFMGMHLSNAHNWIHLISGFVALYFGSATDLRSAKNFDYTFGILYLLLGVFGFLLGRPAIAGAGAGNMGSDSRLWSLIPGSLEFGSADHTVHILLGILFIIGAAMTRTAVLDQVETRDERTRRVA